MKDQGTHYCVLHIAATVNTLELPKMQSIQHSIGKTIKQLEYFFFLKMTWDIWYAIIVSPY